MPLKQQPPGDNGSSDGHDALVLVHRERKPNSRRFVARVRKDGRPAFISILDPVVLELIGAGLDAVCLEVAFAIVYAQAKDRRRPDGKVAVPLHDFTGVTHRSRSSVQEALRTLENRSVVSVVRGTGRGHPNLYGLTHPQMWTKGPVQQALPATKRPVERALMRPVERALSGDKGPGAPVREAPPPYLSPLEKQQIDKEIEGGTSPGEDTTTLYDARLGDTTSFNEETDNAARNGGPSSTNDSADGTSGEQTAPTLVVLKSGMPLEDVPTADIPVADLTLDQLKLELRVAAEAPFTDWMRQRVRELVAAAEAVA